MAKPKHILVIRFSAMGDVAMTVPVIRALTRQYPNLKITVLTKPFFKPFFENLQNTNVFCADLNGRHKGILGLFKLSRELKSLHFEGIADLHNVLRTKILKFFFFGKKITQLDKGRAEKKALTTGVQFQQLKTTHQRYADVFEALDLPIDVLHPIFPKPIPLSEKLNLFFQNKEKKTIGIAPFATYKSKIYPLVQMETVIEELSKTYNVILFGGGLKEIKALNLFEAKYQSVRSVAGKLTLNQELAIMSNLDIMLSMDSGNAHIAAMLGIKVITIWGVTHPFIGFSPFNQPDDYALVADRNIYPLLPTSVYGNTCPKGYETAAGSISVASIIDKIKKTC